MILWGSVISMFISIISYRSNKWFLAFQHEGTYFVALTTAHSALTLSWIILLYRPRDTYLKEIIYIFAPEWSIMFPNIWQTKWNVSLKLLLLYTLGKCSAKRSCNLAVLCQGDQNTVHSLWGNQFYEHKLALSLEKAHCDPGRQI